MVYPDYLTHAFEQFTQAHDQWRLTFAIDDYKEWYYDQATGLLTFSNGEDKVYFRYVPVGSFSTKTNSWLWSWHNRHSTHPQKKRTDAVRAFGAKHGYRQLSTGHLPDGGDPGWDYTAIAYDQLGGTGGYRVKAGHLLVYMLVTDKVDHVKAERLLENTEDATIQCGRHGVGRMAFTCGHLGADTRLGFNEAFETQIGMLLEPDDDFQCWCDSCEAARVEAGGWDEQSQAVLDLQLICEDCYFEFKAANRRT